MAISSPPHAASDNDDDDETASFVDIPSMSQPSPTLASQHVSSPSAASTGTVDVEAWTVSALQSLNISPIARGTGTALSIPLDGEHHPQGHGQGSFGSIPAKTSAGDDNTPVRTKLRHVSIRIDKDDIMAITPPRRPPSRRDSMRRREALLMGNEGSRQRRRWENDRLLHVPNVEPPLPTDWEVRPTHPVNHVPYQLAQFWDRGLRERVEARKTVFAAAARRAGNTRGRKTKAGKKANSDTDLSPAAVAAAAAAAAIDDVGRVPRDLRATAKRTPAVKSWLRDLEEPVRRFLIANGIVAADSEQEEDEVDSEDEEIVFVGRNVAAAAARQVGDKTWKKAHREVPDRPAEAGMVLESSAGEDEGAAAFKRWLTHSISGYYGLASRSVTVGNPERRVVYVGVRRIKTGHVPAPFAELPPPLWEMF